MYYEDVFKHIGDFGPYQLCVLLLSLWIAICHGYQAMATIFLGANQEHWCFVEQLQNLTIEQQQNIAIPWDRKNNRYSRCTVYDVDWNKYTPDDFATWNRTEMTSDMEVIECGSWVHNTNTFDSTMSTEWDLVCGDSWLVQMTSTVYLLGILIGAVLSGLISDRIGRRRPLLVYIFLYPVFGIAAAFSPNIHVYIILRLGLSICAYSAFLTCYVIMTELVGGKYRAIAGILVSTFFNVGVAILAVLAYFIRDFRTLQIVLCIPLAVTIACCWMLPESPRWLVTTGRYHDAQVLFERVARFNKKTFPKNWEFDFFTDTRKQTKQATIWDVMKNATLRKYLFIMFYVWTIICVVYYGLTLNIGALFGNIFLNCFLMSVADVCVDIFSIYCNGRFGRRLTLGIALLVAGIANYLCIPLLIYSVPWLLIAFTITGKAGSTMGYAGVYLMTAELFPTEVRHIAVGSSSTVSRVGGLVAPYLGGPMGEIWSGLPSIIFGTIGVGAGALVFMLPETRDRRMPNTMRDLQIDQTSDGEQEDMVKEMKSSRA